MMLVYGPIISWAFLAMVTPGFLHAENPLYLCSATSYILATCVVHVAYGLDLEFATKCLITKKKR